MQLIRRISLHLRRKSLNLVRWMKKPKKSNKYLPLISITDLGILQLNLGKISHAKMLIKVTKIHWFMK